MGTPDQERFPGKVDYYKHIAVLLYSAFPMLAIAIVLVHAEPAAKVLRQLFSVTTLVFLKCYLWGALGATIASYKFFAEDKERNELEALKEVPAPTELRYPNSLDVALYGLRILFCGVLGVVSGMVLVGGMDLLEVPVGGASGKQGPWYFLSAFIVGLYQNEFLGLLRARITKSPS
jgi:hypothetical protein